MIKQHTYVTTTFSFGQVNMIKFPDFSMSWSTFLSNSLTFLSLEKIQLIFLCGWQPWICKCPWFIWAHWYIRQIKTFFHVLPTVLPAFVTQLSLEVHQRQMPKLAEVSYSTQWCVTKATTAATVATPISKQLTTPAHETMVTSAYLSVVLGKTSPHSWTLCWKQMCHCYSKQSNEE